MNSTEEARFREWAAARSPSLLRLAFLLCGDRHTAEDLTQEALVKTALRCNRIESVDNPDAYVRRIVTNQFRRV